MDKKKKWRVWFSAARLRTLPLAMASTVLGSFLAAAEGLFQWQIFALAAITTISLQILSNFANDFGDYSKGTDNSERIGPLRTVQSGAIKPGEMKLAVIITSLIAFVSGSMLIFTGIQGSYPLIRVLFFLLGIAAIAAAVKYTIGKSPYGYNGAGDIFVFIFFGLLGVSGTYYLHTNHFAIDLLLPSASVGFLSAGVLNLNNMRDYENDKKNHKNTMVVMMGENKAKIYHVSLIVASLMCGLIYIVMNYHSQYQFIFLLTLPLFISNIITVVSYKQNIELNAELKKLAISTLLFSVTFGMGFLL